MPNSKILITGGSGFIGSNLLEYYLSKGHSVLNLDISLPRNQKHLAYWKQTDILDYEGLSRSICEFKPHFVFHLAARTDLDGSSLDAYKANVEGVTNIQNAIQAVKSIKRILFASSRLVCKIGYTPISYTDYCPPNFYGESKAIGEQLVRDYAHSDHYDWLIFRPTSIWGPWFDVPYRQFFNSVISNKYVHPGNLQIPKSFGYVGNSVFQLNALSLAASELISDKTFYLADYPPIDVLHMANLIRKGILKSPVRSVPIAFLRLLASVGDIAKFAGVKNPPLTSFRLSNLLTPMIYDLSELEEIAGTLPFSLEEGVTQTLYWINSNRSGK